jgi:hypothetical protein
MVRPRDVCVSAQSELGIPTVGIYSKEDHLCPHRYKADESYLVCVCLRTRMRVSSALAVHSTLTCKLLTAARLVGNCQRSLTGSLRSQCGHINSLTCVVVGILIEALNRTSTNERVCLAAPPPLPPSCTGWQGVHPSGCVPQLRGHHSPGQGEGRGSHPPWVCVGVPSRTLAGGVVTFL